MNWAVVSQIFTLVLTILGEYYAEQKRAREATDEAGKKQASFDEIAARALEKVRAQNRASQKQDQDFQDHMDQGGKP